jgi:hypothetical protein
MFFPAFLYSQDFSYEVLKTGNVYSSSLLNEAFAKANFCGRINPNASYVIKFDDGAEVKIVSAAESKISEKAECVRLNDVDESSFVWSVSSNGTLLKLHTKKPAKTYE